MLPALSLDLLHCMDTNNRERTHMIVAGIAGILVGFFAGWMWVDTGKDKPASETTDTASSIDLNDFPSDELKKADNSKETSEVTPPTPPTPSVSAASDNKISVEIQSAGKEVAVSSVALTGESWIVIHEDEAGKPLRILGAKRLNAGTYTNVVVKLLRETVEGHTYYAMLHGDDGDGLFDSKKDMVETDISGAPIIAKFETSTIAQ